MSSSDATSLRVALVIHALQGGGAERLMSQLANRWALAGHEIHLITLALPCPEDYSLDAQVHRQGLGLVGESRGGWHGALANWGRVQQLKQVLQQLRPDFILSFCDQMNIVTATAARRMTVPRWLAEHSDPRRQRLGFLWEQWRSWAYPRASGLVVLTEPIAAHMQQRFPGLSIKIIPPAINPVLKHEPLILDTDQHQQQTLLAMGRHSPEKNYSGLLRAWKLIEAQFPQWHLVLAGDGPEHRNLQSLASELQLDTRVRFPGWINDPWELLAGAEVVVLSSTYEGVPLALLEAMSLGRVCVTTPCCDSVVRWAEAGALVKAASESPADLAAAIQGVLANPTACEPIRQAAVSVSMDYNWSHVGKLWDHLLLTMANRRSA